MIVLFDRAKSICSDISFEHGVETCLGESTYVRRLMATVKFAAESETLLRTKTDELRVVLSSLSSHESQAFVATARGSSSQGFSIDVVRANEKEQWGENQQITVNWFAWGSDVEKFLTSEKRGSLRLDNSSKVESAHYRISFNPALPKVPKAVVASARNANRAQVLAVNVVAADDGFIRCTCQAIRRKRCTGGGRWNTY